MVITGSEADTTPFSGLKLEPDNSGRVVGNAPLFRAFFRLKLEGVPSVIENAHGPRE